MEKQKRTSKTKKFAALTDTDVLFRRQGRRNDNKNSSYV
jgi:hypothetical protein